MLPMDGKHRWMFAVEIAILFHGIFLKNSKCESSDANEMCRQKNVLLVGKIQPVDNFYFPTKAIYRDVNGSNFCFNVCGIKSDEDCCHSFDCSFNVTVQSNTYSLILKKETLSMQDIVLMTQPDQDFSCMPSKLYNKTSGFLLNIHNCLKKGVHNIRWSQNGLCGESSPYDEEACKGLAETDYILTVGNGNRHCVSCKPPVNIYTTAPPTRTSLETTGNGTSITTETTVSRTRTTTKTTVGGTSTTSETTVSRTHTTTETTVGGTSTTNETTVSGTSTTNETTVMGTSTTNETTVNGTSITNETTVGGTSTTNETTVNGTSTTNESTVSGTSTTNETTFMDTSTTNETTVGGTSTTTENGRLKKALDIMNNLTSLLGNLNRTSIKMDDIKGVITRLPHKNQIDINIGITCDGVSIAKNNINDFRTGYSRLVQIPKEASAMAVKRNGSFAGVVLFPGIRPHDPHSSFVNDEILGIEMGAKISNLSHTIDIHFRDVDKNGKIASCRSWDGNGKEQNWITDGCQTSETSEGITCQCSHLTFFAILLSPPGNISASDFKSLTYITSVGCGLSMFFLAVGLFMHCLIRKQKASQATNILMNLFVAMFNLNLSFLVNETIADLGNFGACVAIAAVMHYTMLATFTWFFIEALHLYLNQRKLSTEIKHYMKKICITGWAIPAVVVIGVLAAGKYDYLVIYTDDGNSAKMCWISDAAVHQGVNIGYYVIVFIFTFSIFILTAWRIIIFKPATVKAQDISSIKTNSCAILGLFLLLGITWAFAFFSYGPLLIASYYIFTILNSFQGFFLFIYYYRSGKVVQEGRSDSCSSVATSNTAAASPYQ